jgi:hypothetical protein
MAKPTVSDLAYRTVAGIVGGPVDLATMVMRPFGYKTPDENVVGGSEWIGKQLERTGLVSSARAPIQEFLASVAVPTPSGVGKGLAMGAPALAGIFVGKGSRTWDALNAQKAKDLEKAGVDARTIWQQTGTWKGPDGKWRQEIDDSKMKVNREFKSQGGGVDDIGLPDAITHNELFAAYPDAKFIGARHKDLAGTIFGGYSPKTDTVVMNRQHPYFKDKEQLKSAMTHEIQHAIQKREGFARGGVPSRMGDEMGELRQYNEEFEKAFNQFLNATDDVAKANARQQMDFYKNKIESLKDLRGVTTPEEAYARLAGEVEARAVQARINMTPEQRRQTFPPESYDVDLSDLIIRQ